MSFLIVAALTFVSAVVLFKLCTTTRGPGTLKLPRGSLGLPLIGETFSFLQAQTKNRGEEWINERVSKHGPIFKTSLMGTPTVVIVGQAGNKFILGSDEDVLAGKQPKTLSTILGKFNIFELSGRRFKLIKGAMSSFLKPESLQNYIKQMDEVIKTLLLNETKEKDTIVVVDFMKKATFNAVCSILFGINDEFTRQALFDDSLVAIRALWSLPLNFRGTTYWHGLQARSKIINRLLPIMRRRNEELAVGNSSPTSNVMSSLLALRAKNEETISEEMILDNIITLLFAGYDTTATLLTLMVWKLPKEPEIFKKVLEEHMDIQKSREGKDEKLTWVDIQKMKYTWRVAQELMRVIPPAFGSFRKASKHTTFGGYDIPKGWQVFWASCGTHMNEDIFENATEFNPCRFQSSSKKIPPYAYIAFGAGTHSCIGNEFARVEALTTVHRLITMFEWSLVYPDEVITRQPTPYPSKGLPIKIKRRTLVSPSQPFARVGMDRRVE